MESVTDSNLLVKSALSLGLFFSAASLLLIILLTGLRGRMISVHNREAATLAKWETNVFEAVFEEEPPVLSKTSAAPPAPLTKRKRRRARKARGRQTEKPPPRTAVAALPVSAVCDAPEVLYLWNYLHESVRGKGKKHLNDFARRHDLHKLNEKLFRKKSLDKKLLAVNTFGNLGASEKFTAIEKLTAHRDPILSFWAFRALFRIDTARVIADNLQMLGDRTDWSPIFVAKLLKEADPDELSEPLAALVARNYENGLEDRQMSRLISYLTLTHRSAHNEIVNKILAESNRTEELIACLRLVFDETMIDRVRALLDDERWQVRLHAVITLGNFGFEEDTETLVSMLNDLDWWVRYRSARTLLSMPTMTEEKIVALSQDLPNLFARDILKQVLAEEKFQCSGLVSPTVLSK